jgi:hypothetical protein
MFVVASLAAPFRKSTHASTPPSAPAKAPAAQPPNNVAATMAGK